MLGRAEGWERTWVLLGMYAGLRAHEIAKLRAEDVNEDFIYVEGKGGRRSMLPTSPLLWAEVNKYYPRTGYLFPSRGSHISTGRVSVRVGRLFEELGIEGSIHRARHTFATILLREGAKIRVVQQLMRHASLATTAAYAAVDEDEMRAAVHLLPRNDDEGEDAP